MNEFKKRFTKYLWEYIDMRPDGQQFVKWKDVKEAIDEARKEFPKVWDAMDAEVSEWQDTAGDWHKGSCVPAFQEWFVKWFGDEE
jgi:hypothetical protein